jgi:hypothetical protein
MPMCWGAPSSIDKLSAGKYEVRYQNIVMGAPRAECVSGRRPRCARRAAAGYSRRSLGPESVVFRDSSSGNSGVNFSFLFPGRNILGQPQANVAARPTQAQRKNRDMNELDGLNALIIEPHAGMRATSTTC